MSTTRGPPEYGLQGVRLKHFEEVLTRVLSSVQPNYVHLPPVPLSNDDPSPTLSSSLLFWPFNLLPDTARVHGGNPGQLVQPQRALRKEQQLQSMLRCIIALIPTPTPTPPPVSSSSATTTITATPSDRARFTIVDFGGGSGHLAIPLALLLPFCRVVVVELNKKSLELMHQKVEMVVTQVLNQPSSGTSLKTPPCTMESPPYLDHDSRFRRCGRNDVLENLFSFEGPVEEYTESFDMALALHLCGQATDVALRKAISIGAASMVVAPCCVGKLSTQVLNPDVYHATGQNVPTVQYPQSSVFCHLINNPADWDALAKAADYSNEQESRTTRNATRRTAKAVLETDRRLFLETHGYRTALMRMDPWEATPKNDIIVAWDVRRVPLKDGHYFVTPDLDAHADLHVVMTQLLDSHNTHSTTTTTSKNTTPMDCSDWTQDEEEEIQGQISDFLNRTKALSDKMEQVLVFPTRMGSRKRKLIHFVAHRLDLAHWSVGGKDSEKTVAVARRGQNKTSKDDGD